MELSIVIVNWNAKDYLRRCLDAIRETAVGIEYEVIVVDNDSEDGSADMVRSDYPWVHLIPSPDNVGYAEGNNLGIAESSGEYILLLNPDIELKERALAAMLRFAKAHEDAAAVGCRLIGPDGIVQKSCRSFPDPMGVFFEYTRLSRLFPRSKRIGSYRMTWFDHSYDLEVDQPMASCLLISRKAWDDVGGFDTVFPIFFNDVDWCYRAKEKGWKVYFTAQAEALHYGGASTKQVRPEMVRESHRSLRRFYDKHYRGHIALPIYWLISAAIGVNLFFASRFRSSDREAGRAGDRD